MEGSSEMGGGGGGEGGGIAQLTLMNSCLFSLTLTTTKNCNRLCSTNTFRYFLASMGRLTDAPGKWREGRKPKFGLLVCSQTIMQHTGKLTLSRADNA